MTPAELDELRYLAQADERRRMRHAWGCTGKERFESFKHADQVAQRHARQAGRRSAYHCRFCNGYHVSGERPQSVSTRLYQQRKREAA